MTALAVIVLGWCESATVRLAYYTDRLDTYVQTKAGAARYRNGAGRTPSKEEMNEIRRRNLAAFIDEARNSSPAQMVERQKRERREWAEQAAARWES